MALKNLPVTSFFRHIIRNSHSTCLLEKGYLKASSLSTGLMTLKTESQHCYHDNVSLCCVRLLHTSDAQLAGHSKWSNIKHTKAAQDMAKATISNELTRKIQQCLRRNPSTDPKLNSEFASLIKMARTNNIPNETINRTVDRVNKMKDSSSLSTFDGRGLSNIGLVIQCFSLKPHHTKSLLQGIVKKYGFSLHTSAADLFEHKGIIDVDLPDADIASAQADPEHFNLDKFVDIAIEAGAEDVTLEPGEEKPYLQFVCGPQDLAKVQTALEAVGLVVTAGESPYIPTRKVAVSQESMDMLDKLSEKLDLFPDIVKYYHNLQLEEKS